MSTYRSTDPCTDRILDFIAGGVADNPGGESGGNYSAVIGNAHSDRDLSLLTLNEIANLQRQLVNNGEPSSAVGRYQIIEATLITLRDELGLTGEELFTPTLQDRLALALLVGRGYQSWWRGQVGDITFAHGLSCEWASLPDPRAGGRSHYDGVGPNHASTTLTAVYAMLVAARAAKPPAASTAPSHIPVQPQ